MTTRIGDTVHYVSYGTPGGEYPSTCRAAVITEIGEDNVRGLCVLNPTGMFFNREIQYDSPLRALTERDQSPRTPAGGTWHGMDECNPDGQTLSRLWSGDMSGIGPAFGPR